MTSEKSVHGLSLRGYPRSPVSDVFLENCTFANAEKGNVFINVKHVEAKNVTVNGSPLEDIEDEMVPRAVLSTLEKNLNGANVRQVSKYNRDNAPGYAFQLQTGEQRDTLFITDEGNLYLEENKLNK